MSFKIRLYHLPFITGSLSDVSNTIVSEILAQSSQIILPCSLNDLARISESPRLKAAYQAVTICTTDGAPLVWLTRIKHRQNIERVYGPDLMTTLIQNKQLQELNHVFYGSSPKSLVKLSQKIKKIAPKLNIVAKIAPGKYPLDPHEEQALLKKIKQLRPKILWVGLSSPLQIEIAAAWKKHFPDTTIICVGAAFDLIAEIKASAPAWMKSRGLEWLFRLSQEPNRLWRRYLITIPMFLLSHGIDLLRDP